MIFGAPNEQLHDLQETFELVDRIQPSDAICSVLRIYPGTALCRRAISERRFADSEWLDKLDQPIFFYPQGDDFCRAQAACELFTEWFSTQSIRKHPEQNIDLGTSVRYSIGRKPIADWKDAISRHLKGKGPR